MNLTTEQKHTYFEARLAGQRFSRSGESISARCPFHDDQRASLSVNLEKGVYNCHAGCGSGGVLDFERRFSDCDIETAWANIAQISGATDQRLFQQKPEATYQYYDEERKFIFEKLRYPGKRFVQRTRGSNGEWVYKLTNTRRVLYNLPDVIQASDVAICEGEKDCNNVAALKLSSPEAKFATTTNFDGAGKWKSEYSPFLTGKRVVIFEDNDPNGKAHAEQVAASVYPHARHVRIIRLPGLPPKGDVSDWLTNHSADQFLTEIHRTPLWKPTAGQILIQAPQFLTTVSNDIEWLVESVIQRGANGFICSLPKVGKSWLAVDLAISLALGMPWVGFNVPQPVKTALITREDNPALTKWRMRHLLEGKNRTLADLEGRLYVNSREQTPEFRLDKPDLLLSMIAELKVVKPEFVILDVFNVLHGADENDNTEMRAVVEELSRLQREVGCSVGVIHHFNKQAEGSLTQRLRGAGAIAGWAEWLIGLEKIPGERDTRKMQFETKAASELDPLSYIVRTDELNNSTRIERVEWTPEQPTKRHRAEDYMQQ